MILQQQPYTPIHTFTRHPVPAQIISYSVFLAQLIIFFLCLYVNLSSNTTKILILIFYLISLIFQVLITLKCSSTDPSDDLMIQFKNNPKQRYFYFDIKIIEKTVLSHLAIIVKSAKAMQNKTQDIVKSAKGTFYLYFQTICKKNRCVENFDHHCIWINNCVGKKNYSSFIAMIIITSVNMIVYLIGMALLWAEQKFVYFLTEMIAIWVVCVIVAIFWLLLLNLIGLHLYLIHKGLTTYQFIMLQREEEKKKSFEFKSKSQENAQKQTKEQQNKVIMVHQNQQQSNQNIIIHSQSKQIFNSKQIISKGVVFCGQNMNDQIQDVVFAESPNKQQEIYHQTGKSKKDIYSLQMKNKKEDKDKMNRIYGNSQQNVDEGESRTEKSEQFSVERQIKKESKIFAHIKQKNNLISLVNNNSKASIDSKMKIDPNQKNRKSKSKIVNVTMVKSKLEINQQEKQIKQAKQINVSQFFTRNKSLKFIIGDEVGVKPIQFLQINHELNIQKKNSMEKISKQKREQKQKYLVDSLNKASGLNQIKNSLENINKK